jgi:hypothetical protein
MSNDALGIFAFNSISVITRYTRSEVLRAMRGGQSVIGKSGLAYAVQDSQIDWHNVSERQRAMLLTHYHELDHFGAMVENPTGLLMWRCNETIIDDVALLMRMLSDAGLDRIPGWAGLLDWFAADGEPFLATAFPSDAPNERLFRTGAIRSLVDEIRIINEFSEVLFGATRPEITIGAFVSLANRAYSILSERWGIPLRAVWKCREKDADVLLYHDKNLLTVAELMEASARLRERGLMEGAGADAATIEKWESESIFGIYCNGYQLFREVTEDALIAHEFIRMALASPIDPSCIPSGFTELYVEDVVPAYRAIRLLTTYKIAIRLDEVQIKEFVASIKKGGSHDAFSVNSGLLPVRQVLQSFLQSAPFPTMLGRDLTREAERSGPHIWRGCPSSVDYRSVNISKFVDGFSKFLRRIERETNTFGAPIYLGEDPTGLVSVRFREFSGGAVTSPEIAGIMGDPSDQFFKIQPDIIFFEDIVDFCNYYRSSDVFNYHHNIVHYVYSEACRNLLHRMRPKPDYTPLFRAFISRLSWGEKMMKDTSPQAMELKKRAKADEATAEWQALRAAWRDVDQASTAMDEYLKSELGEAGYRSLNPVH